MQVNARKLLLLIVAAVIFLLNAWHLASPAVASTLTPKALAIINAIAAAAVVFLHLLQENGLIDNNAVPGLSTVTGDPPVTATAKVNLNDVVSEAASAIKSVEVAVQMKPDAAAVPAAPTPKE